MSSSSDVESDQDERLEAAVDAFERGDYKLAVNLVDQLDDADLSDAKRARVDELKRKLRPDPLGTKLALFCVVLFLGIAAALFLL